MQPKTTNTTKQPESDGYASDKFLSSRYEVSRATIWRWVRNDEFPRPYKFTSQCTRWKLSDISAWEASQEVSA